MTDISTSKAIAIEYMNALDVTPKECVLETLSKTVTSEYRFSGTHPFNELRGAEAVSNAVWEPLKHSFSSLQRRQDVFMAGPDRSDGRMWVTSMGKFLGLFDQPWLGIPANRKIALIPFCEFINIEDGLITESYLWLDVISVMKQAGLQPLPMQTGADIVFPGPRTGDGLLWDEQDASESLKTLELIIRMRDELLGDGLESPDDNLRNTWHENMLWFGPSGIGSTYTIDRYQQQHQGPFGAGLNNIRFTGHVLEHAEGHYGAWFGWPSLAMNQGEGFLGLPASDTSTEMRIVDVYRRDGEKLAENWIFIDFLHYLKLLGVDVLERCQAITSR